MAIEKLNSSQLYGYSITDLSTATAAEVAGGITLPVIVNNNGAMAYKVVSTKTWSDYVATTTADTISTLNTNYAALSKSVDDIKAKQTEHQTSIDDLNSDYTNMNRAVDDVRKTQTLQQSSISSLYTQYTNVSASVVDVQNIQTKHENSISTLNTEVANANKKITDLQTAQDKQQENLTTLNTNMVKMVSLSQEAYDALVAAGTVDADTYYNVFDE